MSSRHLPDRLTDWLLDSPRSVAALLALIVAISVSAVPYLKFATGLDPFLDKDEPAKAFLDEVNAEFGGDDLLFVAYEAEDVFATRSLQEIRALGERIEAVKVPSPEGPTEGVDEVTSLANVKDLDGADMSYRTVPLVPEDIPTDRAELEAIRVRAAKNPLIRDGLMSEHAPRTVAGFVVRLEPGLDDNQTASVVTQVRALLEAAQRAGQTRYYVTGAPAVDTDMATYIKDDLGRFIPLAYAIVVVLLLIFARRVVAVALALVNITICFGAAMAALTFIGGTVNNLSSMLPPVMMVLSVATIIHFLSELAKNVRALGPAEAPRATIRELIVPVFMCQLTTCVGFGSLGASTIPALQDFGLAAAIAVMMSFVISFLLVAAAATWLPLDRLISTESAALSPRTERITERYADFVIGHPRALLAVGVAIVVVAVVGASRMVVDHNFIGEFDRSSPIRRHTEVAEQHLGGTTQIVVSIKVPEADRFLEPQELAKLEALAQFLEDKHGATQVTSVVDYVKLMHRAFNDNDPAAHRIPDTREQVAQLLLLNGDDTLDDFIDENHRWVRIVARTREHSAARLEHDFEDLAAYLARTFPAAQGYDARPTGNGHLGVTMLSKIVSSQTQSLGLSFLLIFGPIFLVFRSLRATLYTIPSNLFPVVLTLGIMGLVGIPLNASTVMISSIVLGVAVDDTIHFVHHMRGRLRVHGDLERAVRETFATKGIGAVWIALVISLGFAVVVLSNFGPTRNFGLLSGVAMLTGVVGELFVLPPLMLVMRTRLGVRPGTATERAE